MQPRKNIMRFFN